MTSNRPLLAPEPAWQSDTPVALLDNVLRLTAPNPGRMTGPGTNSYLVGTPASGFVAIDPGPDHAAHLQRLWQAAAHPDGTGGNIRHIICTHSHPDHSPGAPALQALCAERPDILGLPSGPHARADSRFAPERALEDGELVQVQGAGRSHTLQVVHTPGHAANHVCLLLVEEGLLFSGDHILNGSTTVIDPPDGNMSDYLQSLDTLHALCADRGVGYILPAHGHPLGEVTDAIRRLTAHRLAREAKIAAVMQAQPQGDLEQWLPLAYDDVDPALWPVARRSLLAHVQRLQARP